ncbi:retrotransposon nucleocapsid protein [Planoprotostelium fungivorum]|uniref:Retrotransposon nucleocapsid protein n=2 Tax=Planoprotostelium fungivorum TaxID=1890364 RepID=A0A2P6NNX0_9EUKA|nr:retrotransposon nucleocapsid protein [Planoprotostelium fungivorum]
MIEKKLFCNLKKCQFHTTRVEFLGYDISPLGLHMCPDRIKSIQDWKPPTNVKETQSFLGFCNFYRNFIPYYSTLSSPLFNLTRKTVAWEWGTVQQKAFDDLKAAFASADVVRHFDNTLDLVLETDASDFAISGILSQTHPDGLRPISFYSRKMKEAELNYDTHDKELLAIVECLKAWRHWILGVSTPLTIYTDHENLRWFSSKQHLNRRQICWSQFLADFNYKLIHRPGKSNVKADLLSRRAQDALDMGDKSSQNQCLLHPELFAAAIIEEEPSLNLKFEESVAELSSKDPFFVSAVEWLKADNTRPSLPAGCGCLLDAKHLEDKDKGFRTEKKLLFYNELLYIPVPLRVTVLQTRHDTPLAGHFGVNKTHELIKRDYWWPKLLRDVEEFVKTCSICQRTKVARQKPAGKLNPLPVPSSQWTSVTMDFIVELPECQGYDAIMVVVDCFTKMAHFTACSTGITSEQTALLFIDRVVRYHGIPEQIISDRGVQFSSQFWSHFWKALKLTPVLSTLYHPETDGQSERTNSVLNQYIRAFCDYHQDDWYILLATGEFAYNNTKHSSIQCTPFFANTGLNPRFTEAASKSISDNPNELAERLQDAESFARSQLHAATKYKPGDQVLLSSENIKTTRPKVKWSDKRLGPYTIIKEVYPNSDSYKLKLPDGMKIHPVFHTSLLTPYYANSFNGRKDPPPQPVMIENNKEYIVERIVDSQQRGRKHKYTEYLVKWQGYNLDPKNNEDWITDTGHCKDALKDYLRHSKSTQEKTIHSKQEADQRSLNRCNPLYTTLSAKDLRLNNVQDMKEHICILKEEIVWNNEGSKEERTIQQSDYKNHDRNNLDKQEKETIQPHRR